MSITTGPSGRILFEFMRSKFSCSRRPVGDALRTAKRLQTSLHAFFVERYLGAIFQFPADYAVTSRDYFVTGLNAVFDFGVSVVGNSSRDFHHQGLVSFFEEQDVGYFSVVFFLSAFVAGFFAQA